MKKSTNAALQDFIDSFQSFQDYTPWTKELDRPFSSKFTLVFLVPVPGGHAVCPSKHLKRLSRSTERTKYKATVAKSVCLLNIPWSAVGVIIAKIM